MEVLFIVFINIFIYSGLFNSAVSNSGCMLSHNEGITVLKEVRVLVAQFEVTFRHLSGRIEEDYWVPQPAFSGLRIEKRMLEVTSYRLARKLRSKNMG
jgi:hypothetical protein